MAVDFDPQPDRRRYQRRVLEERRSIGLQRRSSDRAQLISVTDEEAVQMRLQGYARPLVVHTVPPSEQPGLRFDDDDRPAHWLMRLLTFAWGRK